MTRILGLDPGLTKTGWGLLDSQGTRLSPVAHGLIRTTTSLSLPERLAELDMALSEIITHHRPDEAAVEVVFVNINAESSLKLAHARGVVVMVPARFGLLVREYGARHIKKSVVGTGTASKYQVQAMIGHLLPALKTTDRSLFDQSKQTVSEDAADALAVAICHAHHRRSAHAAQ